MASDDIDQALYQAGDPPTAEGLPEGVVISPDTRRSNRVPPGQTRTRKWPVLDAHGTPRIDRTRWRLRVFGLVERELTFSLEQFQTLPRTQVFADFHCVTRWSRLGNLWEGVSTRYLASEAGVSPKAQFVIFHAHDYGFTTNLPIEEFLSDDGLIADQHDGRPLTDDHGGPVRAIIPRLYAWKSAKWLKGIEFVEQDRPGYWENGGYHNHGDPWKEERFSGEHWF